MISLNIPQRITYKNDHMQNLLVFVFLILSSCKGTPKPNNKAATRKEATKSYTVNARKKLLDSAA
jgi:hypothetical protein